MSDVFLSYSSVNRNAANLIAAKLQEARFSVWWDQRILPGEQFDAAISDALDAALCIVVLWSSASLKSDYVLDEAQQGFQRGILVPVLIEKVNQPMGFRRIEATDLSEWRGEATDPNFARICEGIAKKLNRTPAETASAPNPMPAYAAAAAAPTPSQSPQQPKPIASPQFFVGRWRLDSFNGGSDLIYLPDGTFNGVIVQKLAGFANPIPAFGRWSVQALGPDIFRLQLWFANMTTWAGSFRILDFNTVQNLETNYIASRVV